MKLVIIGSSTLWAACLLNFSAALPVKALTPGQDRLCSYTNPTFDDVLPAMHLGGAKPRRTRRHEASSLRIRYFYDKESISK